MIRGELAERNTGPRLNRRPRSQSFRAVPMKRAVPWPRLTSKTRHPQMACFGMAQTAQWRPADDHAYADARAHGHVGPGVEAPSAAPQSLGERRAIDIGVDGDRHRERAGTWQQGDALPAAFWRRHDAAERRRAGVEVQRPEARKAERTKTVLGMPLLQYRIDGREGLGGPTRGHADLSTDVIGAGGEQTDALRASQLHPRYERRIAHRYRCTSQRGLDARRMAVTTGTRGRRSCRTCPSPSVPAFRSAAAWRSRSAQASASRRVRPCRS